MTKCTIHSDFFDDECDECKKEYNEMKGLSDTLDFINHREDDKTHGIKKYKEFTEERAKKLYEELLIQYIKSSRNEAEAAEKARGIIRKQCSIRGMPFWSWS
jgi:hypothetical protein